MADVTAPTTFQFDLISPEAVLASRPVWQVSCPGIEGMFGVRAGHMPLLAGLKAGVLLVQDTADAPAEAIFISGGFADVTNAQMTVLAEEAVALSALDAHALQLAATNLRDDMLSANDNIQRSALEASLKLVEAKLAAIA